MVRGFDPNDNLGPDVGGCREAFLLTRIAYGVLLPPLFVIVGTMSLIIGSFFLISVNPLLSLVALTPIAAGAVWMIRRDRRIQEELEEDIFGPHR
jgi:hypothetical protein